MRQDPALLERIARRDAATRAIRAWFADAGFVEVETPMLVVGGGLEPHIDPLVVSLRLWPDAEVEHRYLHTSPELALKRVLSFGAGRIYQLARVFRDGERTARHLPEFTLLEWYRTGADLAQLADDCVALFRAMARALSVQCDWAWADAETRTVSSLFADAGFDLDAGLVDEGRGLVDQVRAAGVALRPQADFEDAFFAVMEKHVEPALPEDRAVVVTRWPAAMAALARLCDDDARYAERFEIYARGLELANAFDELTDPAEQRARFERDNAHRVRLGKAPLRIDETFLRDLAHMPPAVGVAVGVDRVLMALLGAATIDEVTGLPWR